MKIKMTLSAIVFALCTMIAMPALAAAPPTNNALSYFVYTNGTATDGQMAGVWNTASPSPQIGVGSGSVDSVNWVALPGQPNRTFHQVCVYDTSGTVVEFGNGTSPNITPQFLAVPHTGSSAEITCLPTGLSYLGSTSSIWFKLLNNTRQSVIGGATQVVQFFY